MAWLLSVPIAAFVVFIVVGAITGHVKVRSCCGIADPRCDARMRDAFRDTDVTSLSCQLHQEGVAEGDRGERDRGAVPEAGLQIPVGGIVAQQQGTPPARARRPPGRG
jgi:hypothetical protein